MELEKPNPLEIPILLASASPRRKFLLEQMALNVRIKPSHADETHPLGLENEKIPAHLAEKKATALLNEAKPEELIIAADSIVILGDAILEKPKNTEEAQQMLQSLSATTHRVVTGVCMLYKGKTRTFSSTSVVKMAPLTSEEIDFYIQQYQPFDKAGSYGIQEWIGWCKVESIQGSYANIMGLPTEKVYHEMRALI